MYFIVAMFDGVEYFSDVFRLPAVSLSIPPVLVFDTASVGPPLRLERRLIIVARVSETANRVVNEIVEVSNPGARTRIARDSSSAVWTLVLPAKASAWRSTTEHVAPGGMWASGDTLSLRAPVWPGSPLRLSYQYALPSAGPLRLPIDQPTAEFGLLLEDTAARITAPAVQFVGVRELEGRRFAAYRGTGVAPGWTIEIAFSRDPLRPRHVIPYVVGVAAAVFAWGLWRALRHGPHASRS